MTLTRYCELIRETPVDAINTEAVLGVLKPLWTRAPETASRLRGRIEAVLDAARARGHIGHNEANPARWRGHLDKLLPKRAKLTHGHHAAMPYADVPAFVASLRERPAIAARALEFCILTAARSGEALAARWDELDMDGQVWTVPAARTKAAREHRVPLSQRAVAILREMEAARAGDYVFPGQRRGRPLSRMGFEMLLRRIQSPYTTHGFRSSFRDSPNVWASFASGLLHSASGSRPAFSNSRPRAAFSRAALSDTPPLAAEPRPASRCLPRRMYMKTQRRRPSPDIDR
jgi:integrase